MRLLRDLGYVRVRHYHGGLADWLGHGGPVEGTSGASAPRPRPDHVRGLTRRGAAWVDAISARSFAWLVRLWGAMVAGCALVYWVLGVVPGSGLREGALRVGADAGGFLTALYFSLVTATSVGFGDVVPFGVARAVAVGEAVAGLFVFGLLVSKLVSRRQEGLTEEIHRMTFETRLGRVRTNLHLVLTEVQAVTRGAAERELAGEQLMVRVESASIVFVGELRAVRDLLYRPPEEPDEEVFEGILAEVAAALVEFRELVRGLRSDAVERPALRTAMSSLGTLAREICSECVPRAFAPVLADRMDRIRALAEGLSAG